MQPLEETKITLSNSVWVIAVEKINRYIIRRIVYASPIRVGNSTRKIDVIEFIDQDLAKYLLEI